MNSQFKNSNLGFVIYAALIAIIAAATFFMLWYMLFGYKVGTYGPDTRLGSVYIGGLREEQIFSRVDEKVDYWYNDDTILFEVKYQNYSYKIDRNVILFNLNTQIYNVEDGVTNEIYVSIQLTDQDTIKSDILGLDYMEDIGSNLDLQRMINDMLDDAALMKSYSCINVEDYLIDNTLSEEIISSVEFVLPQGLSFDDLSSKVNEIYKDGKILIPEKKVFDVLTIFGEDLIDSEMNVMSTPMLKAIQETNFILNEVHYTPAIDFGRYTITNYPFFGNNTSINEKINQSFSFYNPNEYVYYFELVEDDLGTTYLNLVGLPFEYEITIDINKTELDYFEQDTNNVSLIQDGHEGRIIEVVRTIKDVYGNETESLIVYEFYPPVKEINYIIN